MGEIRHPEPVKLVCPILLSPSFSKEQIINLLQDDFGAADYISDVQQFEFTNYYAREMGEKLERFFLAFQPLIEPDKLARIKIRTNEIEKDTRNFATDDRQINIDPGYLEASKFILASTKNYSHRIYLQKGIYAEVTLIYHNKSFQDLPWTYPDYKTPFYKQTLINIRGIYLQQLKKFSLR